MKYIKSFLLILIFIIFVFLILNQKIKEDLVIKDSELVSDQGIDFCYVWNTEYGDKAILKMNLSGAGGSVVNGSFDYIPKEKDSKTGTFMGTAGPVDKYKMARTARVIWNASGEGMTNKEELYFDFGEGNAYPAFGEMILGADNVYVYKNPEKLSYPITMQEVECVEI